MIIVGAKGFATELLQVCFELGKTDDLLFYDDMTTDLPMYVFDKFKIIRTENEVRKYFDEKNNGFALGLGNPFHRAKMTSIFESWGGDLVSLISPKAVIGNYGVSIQKGATILANAVVTGGVTIGRGILMYPNSIVTHDCAIGDFVELSPGATVLGHCVIEDSVHIGANATVLPKLRISSRVVIGAGSVVTKCISEGKVVKGIPAR